MSANAHLDLGESPAYLEVFVTADGPNGTLDCYFGCNICGRRLNGKPCLDHAPMDVPGLQLVECDAEPRHPYVWMAASEGYEPPCAFCASAAAHARIDELTRCRHWGWRRWRSTHRVVSWTYAMGITRGGITSWGGPDHNYCTHGIRWRGSRCYILGWPRWKWSCLLRQRHWPGVYVGLDCCAKCLPCPECGSSSSCFEAACENMAVAS